MNNESEETKDSNGKMPVEDDIGNQLGLIGHVFNRLGLRHLKIIKDSLKDDKKLPSQMPKLAPPTPQQPNKAQGSFENILSDQNIGDGWF